MMDIGIPVETLNIPFVGELVNSLPSIPLVFHEKFNPSESKASS